MERLINKMDKGLNKDLPIEMSQQVGFYTDALNIVNEDETGNIGVMSAEGGTEKVSPLNGFNICGYHEYEPDKFILFLSNGHISKISRFDGTHIEDIISDEHSSCKLNLSINNAVSCTSKVINGCELSIYFTDGRNEPRTINIDKVDKVIKDGNIDCNKIRIQKSVNPRHSSEIKVYNNGGRLIAGSYAIYIQYSNSDGYESDWSYIAKPILIYRARTDEDFSLISGTGGTTGAETYNTESRPTSKMIQVTMSNMDMSYDYYRLAFVCKNNSSGDVNNVLVTPIISTSTSVYRFTGDNYEKKTTLGDILVKTSRIKTAKVLENNRDRLILGNIKEDSIRWHKLQDYANRITSNFIHKRVDVMDMNDGPKAPNLFNRNSIGYMPGEIYSFGIVYVFDDGTESPVFHIPGTDNEANTCDYRYTKSYMGSLLGQKVRHHRFPTRRERGIDIISNQNDLIEAEVKRKDSYYTVLMWTSYISDEGTDMRKADNKFRRDIFKFELEFYGNGGDIKNKTLKLEADTRNGYLIRGDRNISFMVIDDDIDLSNYNLASISYNHYTEEVVKKKVKGPDGNEVEQEFKEKKTEKKSMTLNKGSINGNNYFSLFPTSDSYIDFEFNALSSNDKSTVDTIKRLSTTDRFRSALGFPEEMEGYRIDNIAIVRLNSFVDKERVVVNHPETEIIGIKFDNIDKPDPSLTDGKNAIGYYIVRNKREEADKTVLFTGVLFPMLKFKNYTASGLLLPESRNNYAGDMEIDLSTYALVSIDHKFNGGTLTEFDKLRIDGKYDVFRTRYGKIHYNDVMDGTSVQSKSRVGDDDGWSLDVLNRANYMKHSSDVVAGWQDIEDIEHYGMLDALGFVEKNNIKIYNTAIDNKVAYIKLKEDRSYYDTGNRSVPYVTAISNRKDSYFSFLSRPYYKEHNEMHTFDGKPTELYNGDSYLSGINLQNHVFYDNRIASRGIRDKNFWEKARDYVLPVVVAAASLALAIFTGGTSLIVGASLLTAGSIAMAVSNGIKESNFIKAYSEEYEKGLRKTVLDSWTNYFMNTQAGWFVDPNGYWEKEYNGAMWSVNEKWDDKVAAGSDGPGDDTIRWISDTACNLYMESSYNSWLRKTLNGSPYSFVPTPLQIENGNNSRVKWWVAKNDDSADMDIIGDDIRSPRSSLERASEYKLLTFDKDKNKYRYRGLALGDFWEINKDYSDNDIDPRFCLPHSYDPDSKCIGCFGNRIMWSDSSRQEDSSDAWLRFRANNYKDYDPSLGSVQNVVDINGDLLVHTERNLMKQPLNLQEKIVGEFVSYVGTGDFASLPEQLYSPMDNTIGVKTFTETSKSKVGYGFVSNDGKVYLLSNNLACLSDNGISKFVDNNNLREEQTYNEANYRLTFDAELERIIFTGIDKYSISNDPGSKRWISFHSYKPNTFIQGSVSMYSVDSDYIWKHSLVNHKLKFYDKYYNMSISYGVGDGINITNANSISVMNNTNSDGITIVKTFDRYRVRTKHNDTGYRDIVLKNESSSSYLRAMVGRNTPNDIDYHNNIYTFSGLRDSSSKSWINKSVVSGEWHEITLELDGNKNGGNRFRYNYSYLTVNNKRR